MMEPTKLTEYLINTNLGFIGAGKMAQAIADGLVKLCEYYPCVFSLAFSKSYIFIMATVCVTLYRFDKAQQYLGLCPI